MQTEILIEKIKHLSTPRQVEVADFVEFLTQKEERKLVESAMKMSEESFSEVWDNEEDSVYDKL